MKGRPQSRYNVESVQYKNTEKYLYPPTWEQIEEFINELGVSFAQFEKYYGLNYNHLTQVKRGQRQLSKSYWAIIYEKIKPKFGIGTMADYVGPLITIDNRKQPQITKPIEKIEPIKRSSKTDNHNRLSTLK